MYTRFGDNDKVTRQAQELVTSTWTNNTNNLQVAHTASAQADFTTATSSGQFYIEVYNAATSSTVSEVQYALSYGHRNGSGSPDFTNDTGSFGLGASRVIYNQYRQLHYNDDTTNFTFGDHTPDDIYIINVNRARYKQKLTLGSLNLQISGNCTNVSSESMAEMHLTDDSVTNGQFASSNLGPVFRIVSGTNGAVSGSTTNQLTINTSASNYGNYYPQAGLIILNGDAFSGSANGAGLRPGRNAGGPAANTDRNNQKLFNHISAAGHFIIDTTEAINSQFYFCRVRNDQYNYTNNDSFVDASNNIRFDSMKLNPKVFITTIGLYNDAFELLGIAKMSQPVAKDFTKEALIRVKLDY